MVSPGKELITLDARELEAQKIEAEAAYKSAHAHWKELNAGYRHELIEKAQAQVKEQEENLKKLKSGTRIEEIQVQEAKMKAAQAEYDHSSKTYDRITERLKQGVVAEQEKDDARRSMDMARERLQAEKKNYELLKAGPRVEDIEIAAARLAQARAELKQLQAGPRKEELERAEAFMNECKARENRLKIQLEEGKIVSPTEARVEVCDLEPGNILAPGQVAVTLLKPNDLWVKIYVKGHEFHRVEVHRKVEVTVELSRERDFRSWALRQIFSFLSEPHIVKTFPGEIVHIASQSEFTPRNVQTKEERGNQVFAIKVKIIDTTGFLRPGMSAIVKEVKSP
jgi:HlyD family secretion protein